MSQIQIRDGQGVGIPGINIRISISPAPPSQAIFDVFTDHAGNTGWPIPYWPDWVYTLWANVANVNPAFGQASYQTSTGPQSDIVFTLPSVPPVPVELPELVMADRYYMNVFIQGATGFLDYLTFYNNDLATLRTIYRQCQAVGCNARSVMFALDDIAQIHPEEMPGFYDRIPDFLDFSAEYGQYIYAIYYADAAAAFSNAVARRDHFPRMNDAIRQRRNRFINLANERKSHTNFIDNPHDFAKPAGMVSVCGSFTYQDDPGMEPPFWDLFDYHTPRKLTGSVKDQNMLDHPARWKDDDFTYCPNIGVISGEPQLFGPDPRPDGKHGSLDATLAREMGIGSSKGTAAGTFFHSPAGKLSIPFQPEVLPCLDAWFDA